MNVVSLVEVSNRRECAWLGKPRSNNFHQADDISDFNNPFYTEATTHVNWFWNYRKKIFNDRVDWRVQVNVSNLFNMDTSQARNFYNSVDGDYDSDVVYNGIRRYDPRRISNSNTFKF